MVMGLLLKFCTNNKEITSDDSILVTTETGLTPTGKKISPQLFGFNTENLYFHYKGESSAQELIKALGPKVLRFPGGTPANVYHIDGPGYGYSKQDADRIEKGSGPYKNAQKCVRLDGENNRSKSQQQNYAEDFATLLKANNAQVLLVANLIGSSEDVLDMVRFFEDEGVEIAGVELGNEFYFTEYRDVFPTVRDYIAKAKETSALIREEFPSIPLAVTAAPNDGMKRLGMRQKLMSSSWNEALNEEDFYDAVVIHMYSKKRSCDDQSEIGRFDCYLDHNTTYVSQNVGTSLERISQTFSGRPIWLTEWNLKDVFNGLGNTFLQSIYYVDYSMALINTDAVQMATYHNLLNGGEGHNIIGKNKNRPTTQAPSHAPRAVFPVAQLCSSLYEGSYDIMEVPELGLDLTKIGVNAFENEKELVLIIVNRSSADMTLGGTKLIDILPGYSVKLHSVIGDGLTKATSKELTQEASNRNNASEMKIPALSVTKISLQKDL